ncbi:MAG TPA: FHA domain-containing protein [Chloroflexia bacterium]|jgi:hypothetical protein
MSSDRTRLEVRIDVLDLEDQRALAEPELAPGELIAAIVEEFRDLEYLSSTPGDYRLLKSSDGSLLVDDVPIGEQLAQKERLILTEKERPLPEGATLATRQVYLREKDWGRVFRLHWFPAIIGRPDVGSVDNERLAVDLADHPQGIRVSRRHAKITEEAGQYYIESLSQNKTFIEDRDGTRTLLTATRLPLEHGASIYLDGSQVTLKFIVRGEEGRDDGQHHSDQL